MAGMEMVGNLVRKAGFEPATYRLGGGCSIQLSYKRKKVLIWTDECLRIVQKHRRIPSHLCSKAGITHYINDHAWHIKCEPAHKG